MDRIKKEMKVFVLDESLNADSQFQYPTDQNSFSYFVISNLPLDSQVKTRLLKENSSLIRLRFLNVVLSSPFDLVCSSCSHLFATKKDLLVVSRNGTSDIFVNPSGAIFQLFTFRNIENAETITRLLPDYCWYPKYNWAILW